MARDVRDLVKNPPEGIRLVLDDETGMPGSLSEIMVRRNFIFVYFNVIWCGFDVKWGLNLLFIGGNIFGFA